MTNKNTPVRPVLPSPSPRSNKPWFYLGFSIVFAMFLGTAYLLWKSDHTQPVEVLIPRGSNLTSVSYQLAKENIISYPEFFRRFLQFTGGSKRVRAGEFRFNKGATWLDTLFVLYYQEPIVHSMTIPEGYNAKQIAVLLEQTQLGNAARFLALALSKESATKFGIHSPTLEGYLFPDTYFFSKVDGEEKILERMVQRFFSKLDNNIRNQIRVSGMTLEQVVTFASIVEKETGVPNERPIISSVFHNRLKKGMRLQSDPTIIYGIVDYDGNIKKKHISEATPYNTYVIKGLPPGPIASPGVDAIRATLSPANTKYFYFVANNQGSHVFSETYEQHARYVDQLQKRRTNASK